jgi:hypothetical protein
MTHHYDYRLPPDTFLARRDSNWYIGATPDQQLEVKRWSDAIASLQQSEAAIMVQAQTGSTSSDPKKKAREVASSSEGSGHASRHAYVRVLCGVGGARRQGP